MKEEAEETLEETSRPRYSMTMLSAGMGSSAYSPHPWIALLRNESFFARLVDGSCVCGGERGCVCVRERAREGDHVLSWLNRKASLVLADLIQDLV